MDSTTNTRGRSSNNYIRVTYPDGNSICYKSATMTFLEVLRRLSVEQLSSITLEVCHLPFISQEIYPQYAKYMKPVIRGWYANFQSDTKTKYMQLLSINDELQLGLKIEIGEDLEPTTVKGFGKSRGPKDNLLVKFPDGHYVAEENPKATYIETLRRLGIQELRRKGLSYKGKDLLSNIKTNNQQIELEEEKLWLTVPGTTKDKYKALMTFSAIMHVKIEMSII